MKNYFYKQSELPPLRFEILGEILSIDYRLNNLLLKTQGNYRELQKLAEILGDSLDNCELNLDAIKIFSDSGELFEQKTNFFQPSLADLPLEQQTVIFSSALFAGMLLSVFEIIYTEKAAQYLVERLTEKVQEKISQCSPQQITNTLTNLLNETIQNPKQTVFRLKILADD